MPSSPQNKQHVSIHAHEENPAGIRKLFPKKNTMKNMKNVEYVFLFFIFDFIVPFFCMISLQGPEQCVSENNKVVFRDRVDHRFARRKLHHDSLLTVDDVHNLVKRNSSVDNFQKMYITAVEYRVIKLYASFDPEKNADDLYRLFQMWEGRETQLYEATKRFFNV